HAAFEGIEQRQGRDDGDREDVTSADRDGDHDGDGEDAYAFCSSAGNEEEAGGCFMKHSAQALIDELVGGWQPTLEVAGQEECGHHDTADHVADDDLKKTEVAGEGDARDADDGERAGLGRDDGEGDGPPGDAAVGKKVALERLRCSAIVAAE